MGGYATGGGAPSADVWFNNIAIVTATTTNANDSIKITGADGQALGVGNPGWIDLPATTAGRATRFLVTADVTLLLTAAHFGFGTTGDLTGELLRVLAINDNGTLRFGVALLGGRNTLLTTDTTATAASVTAAEHVLMKTAAVGSATNSCRELGFFRSNFDDTGGAAEDLWANQTGVNDFYTGISADGYYGPWNPGYTGFVANPTAPLTRWTQLGRFIFVKYADTAGTSNATGFTITLLPAKAAQVTMGNCGLVTNNSAAAANGGWATGVAGTTLTMAIGGSSTGWTAAGTKGASFFATYEVGPVASFLE